MVTVLKALLMVLKPVIDLFPLCPKETRMLTEWERHGWGTLSLVLTLPFLIPVLEPERNRSYIHFHVLCVISLKNLNESFPNIFQRWTIIIFKDTVIHLTSDTRSKLWGKKNHKKIVLFWVVWILKDSELKKRYPNA